MCTHMKLRAVLFLRVYHRDGHSKHASISSFLIALQLWLNSLAQSFALSSQFALGEYISLDSVGANSRSAKRRLQRHGHVLWPRRRSLPCARLTAGSV
mmetsp:Transcript_7857/g.20523  ORF Transcript_7857/g.20523 Transcript_7857/m.20523 type:complete len:98 (+) Transcript_7857:643-936(+)